MTHDWLTALRNGAAEMGIVLSSAEEDSFARYLHLLLEWNTRMNLTAITEPAEVAGKHFLDSLAVERVWEARAGQRAVDFGTGAGFPGIPLAIRHAETRFTLVDSVRKKVDFLQAVKDDLSLANVSCEWGRAEEFGHRKGYRENFDIALARAVAHLGLLIEYAIPLLKTGGRLIAMKGPSGLDEIPTSKPAFNALGCSVSRVERLFVPGAGERVLIVVRKDRPTDKQFPREAGMMKKRPLQLDRGASRP